MEVKAPLNFHQPGLADGSYVIFVGDRQKLCNFRLLTFIGQGPTEDKMKPTKKVFFCGFWLIFHWPMEVQQFPVVWVRGIDPMLAIILSWIVCVQVCCAWSFGSSKSRWLDACVGIFSSYNW
jgi:hypothetical protein